LEGVFFSDAVGAVGAVGAFGAVGVVGIVQDDVVDDDAVGAVGAVGGFGKGRSVEHHLCPQDCPVSLGILFVHDLLAT